MSKQIKLKRGLDIKLKGKPEKNIVQTEKSGIYAVKPTDFKNLTPKLLIKEGDKVKAGTPIFFDKYNPKILFTSPVSGEIKSVVRGERRKILEIEIASEQNNEYEDFDLRKEKFNDKNYIIETLLKSGFWATITQRPYGIIANPENEPKAIHISTFDTSPLAPDYNFIMQDKISDFQNGIDFLSKLTSGKVHVNIDSKVANNIFKNVKNAVVNEFSGPHPIGNPSIQIHHLTPVNKGETVWVVKSQDVANIGSFFNTGKYDVSKIIALAGSEIDNPQYYRVVKGFNVESLVKKSINQENVRVVSGNVLSGSQISIKGFLGFYDDLITVIPEGNYYELFGWAMPGFKKFSTSRTFFSWLNPKKEYVLDTNLHGGPRAFVVTGEYEKYVPMDILPMQLFKSILAEDIDKMEQLGIYEVVEDDFALCEFACPSKSDIQEIIKTGISLMIKEMN